MKESAYTGKGVGVALFDTGIYPHMDFGDRIYAFADFIHTGNYLTMIMVMERVWRGS